MKYGVAGNTSYLIHLICAVRDFGITSGIPMLFLDICGENCLQRGGCQGGI